MLPVSQGFPINDCHLGGLSFLFMQNMNVAVRRDTESWISTLIAKNIRKKTEYSVKQSALNPFIKHHTCYECIYIILSACERQLQIFLRRKQTSITVGLLLKMWQIQKK